MSLVIGCPVRKREWILPVWKEFALEAAAVAGFDPKFLFVVGEDDVESVTWDDSIVRVVSEPVREDQRSWTKERLNHMVWLRNILLGEVRSLEPKYFLSLDSDILIHRDAIKGMMETLAQRPDAWAAGGKTYMAPGRDCPSYGMFNNAKQPWAGFKRRDKSDILDVDILMAVKLMTKPAYETDYVFHRQGEDLGWSMNVTSSGGVLLWDGRTCSKHVMSKDRLEKIDARCGY